ncbi:DUF502 domain-containing protein [Mangrovibacterium lignilyticum]|uniref:DUF502 domain-containing protein n=1 Tax=Mangrovibacterium lignilyticum TaxID=2668052 RepID=UPI0013D7CD0B|nr:DUF502 domain-containing protein [Mangrovibacterium lignilyticum]
MKKILDLFRTTLVGGLVFLFPMVLLLIIIQKALSLVKLVVDPLVAVIPFDSAFGFPMHRVLGVTILVLICLLAGYLANSKAAKQLSTSLEEKILSKLPGYTFYKKMGESMVGLEEDTAQSDVVFVKLDDAKQLAFLMDKLDDEQSVVFVPDSPNPFSGSVLFVSNDRIEATNLSRAMAFKICKQMGGGSRDLITPAKDKD